MNFLRKLFASQPKNAWVSISGNHKGYSTNYTGWSFVAIDKIAQTISQIEIFAEKNGEKTESIAIDLIKKPNEYSTPYDLVYSTISLMLIYGEAYWILDSEDRPSVIEVAKNSQAFYDADKRVFKYQGEKIDIDRVIVFKNTNPMNPKRGQSRKDRIGLWLENAVFSDQFKQDAFLNGGYASSVLETSASTAEQLEEIRGRFNASYTGNGKRNKTIILGKDQKFTPVNQDVLGKIQDGDPERDRILSAYGVPASVLGITESGMSRADAEAKNAAFLQHTIEPMVKNFLSHLNTFYLTKFSNFSGVTISYPEIVPKDSERQIAYNKAALAGQSWMTINEIRASEGLPPLQQGGDQVMATGFPTPIGIPEEQKQSKKPDFKDVIKKSWDKKKANKLIYSKVKLTEEMKEKLTKEFHAKTEKYEKDYIKILNQNDQRIINTVMNNQKSFITKEFGLNLLQEEQTLFELSLPLMTTLFQEEGTLQMDALQTLNPFLPFAEELQEALRDELRRHTDSYTQTSFKRIKETVTEGFAEGLGEDQIEDNLRNVLSFNPNRAMTMARTTVHTVSSRAIREAFIQSGVVKTVIWYTAGDEKVCRLCKPMDGKVRKVKEIWYKKGEKLASTSGSDTYATFGDIKSPSLHTSCRCREFPGEISVD